MDTTSNLPWVWVIETLASSKEINTSLLVDLVRQTPEFSDDMGRNAKELVSLRVLETLFVHGSSNVNNDASVPGDKIEFDRSACCEGVLRRSLSGVSSDQKMDRPEMSKWDVQSFITRKRSCLPKCSLQQIKDAVLDSTNPLPVSLKAKSRLEVGNHSRDGNRLNDVDLNGIGQRTGVRGFDAQNDHILSGNATSRSSCSANGIQENQPRKPLMPSKRKIDAPTDHEGEDSETEPISENSSDPSIKASKKFKQEVISSRRNVVHDLESSQRDGVATGFSTGIPRATVGKGNLENGALVGGLDGSCEFAASKRVRQSTDSSSHDELLPQRMISEEKIQNVGSSRKACAELRTSIGSSQQAVHQDSCINGTDDLQGCNRGDFFKGEPSKGANKNTLESDEPEFSSDSDGYHNEKTGLSAKRNDFVNSQCTQGLDSLATENGRELNLCVKCNEGGQLLVCSSDTCPLVVHQSCLASVPSFDNRGDFYCPFCAYSRAISEFLECKRMASLTRKDLTAFFGFGARRQSKKSSHSSRRTKQKQSRGDDELCCDKNKDSLNEVTEAKSAPEASVPREPMKAGTKSKKSAPRSHRTKQKLSRGEEELCNNENNNKNSPNEVKEPGDAPVDISSPNANVTHMGSPQPEACAPPELVNGQGSFVEESPEDEDAIASRYCVRFRNADKNYFFKFAVPILQFLK